MVSLSADDVEVGQGVAVLGDEDAGAAALAARREDGDDRRLDLLDDGDALLLRFQHALVHVVGAEDGRQTGAAETQGAGAEEIAAREMIEHERNPH